MKTLLFDLDDTICRTRIKFIEKMGECVDLLSQEAPKLNKDEWRKEIVESNNRLFEKHCVNPRRWYFMMQEMRKKHRLSEETARKAREILKSIYRERLDFLDGAEEGLAGLKKMGMKLKILTHASKKWTRLKYKNWLKLDRFLGWDDVLVVDINKHKTDDSWLMACKCFGVKPNEVAVVGDSPRSDINPARRIGVESCFLVEDEIQWSVQNQPVDTGVVRVKNLKGVI